MNILKVGITYLIIILTVGIAIAVIFYWDKLLTYQKFIFCFYMFSIIADIIGRIIIKVKNQQIDKMIKDMHKNSKENKR